MQAVLIAGDRGENLYGDAYCGSTPPPPQTFFLCFQAFLYACRKCERLNLRPSRVLFILLG